MIIVIIFCIIVVYLISGMGACLFGGVFEYAYGDKIDYSIVGGRDNGILFLSLCPIINTLFTIFATILCFIYFLRFIFVETIWGFIRDCAILIFSTKFWKSLYVKLKGFITSVFSNWKSKFKFFIHILSLPFKK